MSKRLLVAAVTGLLLAPAAYWYGSPYLTLYRMQAAAKALDAETFNAQVDYPQLRASLKAELTGNAAQEHSPGQSFGALLAEKMMGGLVDALVRPAVVMQAMKAGRLPTGMTGGGSAPGQGGAKMAWSAHHEGLGTFVMYVGKAGESQDQRTGLVLTRSGFASWHLTGIRLPAALHARLAR